MLFHVLDGNGITMGGFDDGPPDAQHPLRHIWRNEVHTDRNDRMSASVANKRHPDIFRCLICPVEWFDLPAIVLKPSAAVQKRISCLGWRDMGSFGRPCWPWGGSDECVSGCPKPYEWCDKHGGVQGQTNCNTGFGEQPETCCLAWAPDMWTELLEMQDQWHRPWGSCWHREGVDCNDVTTAGDSIWLYNEIVVDRARHPWGSELHEIIEAVAIAPRASDKSKAFAKAVHTALLRLMIGNGVNNLTLPLLYYDAAETRKPFTLAML